MVIYGLYLVTLCSKNDSTAGIKDFMGDDPGLPEWDNEITRVPFKGLQGWVEKA